MPRGLRIGSLALLFGVISPFVIRLLSDAAAAVLGGLLTICAALAWGVAGGIYGAVSAALMFSISFALSAWTTSLATLLAVVSVYFVLGIAVGMAMDRSSTQRDWLRQSNERLELALWGGQQGLWDWDIRAGTVYRDDYYMDLIGYSREELAATLGGWQAIVHPDDLPAAMASLKEHLQGGSDYFRAEFRMLTKSRKWRWIVDRGRVVARDANGRPLRVVGISQDVTDRKEMERALELEKERLDVTLRSIGDAVISTDHEGRLVFMNKVAEDLTGWSEAEAMGRPVKEVFRIVNEETGREAECPVRKALDTRAVVSLANHTVLISKDGVQRNIADSAAPIHDRDGEVIGVIVVFRDVTEEKALAEALRNSEQTYRNIFHNAQVGLIRSTKEGIVLEANDQCAHMFGYRDRDDFIQNGRTDWHYANPSDRFRLLELLERTEQVDNFEVELIKKTGQRSWVRLSVRHLPEKGWLEGVIEDVTTRKKAEEELKKSRARYRYLYEESPIGLVTCDSEGNVLEVNRHMLDIAGIHDKNSIMGFNIFRNAAMIDSGVSDDLRRAIDTKTGVRRERTVRLQASGEQWLHYRINPIVEENGTVREVTIACEDVTAEKETEARIRYLSFHDKLTGLYNRAYFEEELSRLDSLRQLPLSIILGDVNGLKLVNDAFGHQEGDGLLKEIAGILEQSCRREDIIARWGGDEFAILLPKTTPQVAEKICQRIKAACESIQGRLVQPSIALGTAAKMTVEENVGEVVTKAEDRMYRNKLIESTSTRGAIVLSLTSTLREKSYETEEHAERLKTLALSLGRVLGMSGSELDELSLMAALHDIGKIAVSDEILMKSGELTPEQWETIKKHPEIGYRIAQSLPDLAPIAEAILAHHERWDGTGYPRGLKGEQIPLVARVIALVDAYDVMTNERPYRGPISCAEALEELKRCAGTQFDPKLVCVFVKMMSDLNNGRDAAAALSD